MSKELRDNRVKPKVTVVIPNFNHAGFLETRFNSVLNQTYQDFEVIYLDDGSTDESAQVFARFAGDPRVRSAKNDNNSGLPFKQWNKGVRLGQGEYVWIAESDDYADTTFLSKLTGVLDSNPSVGLAYCKSIVIGEHDSSEEWPAGKRWEADFVDDGKDECKNYLLLANTIPNASAVLFRRSIFEKAGYADESMAFCGDWLLWIKMLLISDVAFVSECLNYYRRHPGSVSSRMSHTLAYLEERYRVISHVKRNLSLDKTDLEQACESSMDLWVRFLLLPSGMKAWRLNAGVYRAAREVDSRAATRFLKKLSIKFFTRFHIIAPIRSSRRFLMRFFWFRRASSPADSKP
jgi:glycosyltransferase involved in cell wall biosynthesis